MKVLMKAKAVAILTAFLMVFAMMPLVAFGEETPEEENPAGDPVYEETEEGLESETVAEGAAVNNEEQTFSAKGDTKDVIEYNLWVGTERVTSENLSGEGNAGKRGTWTFTPANGDDPATLTLEDFTYEGKGYARTALNWLDSEKLTILLKGTSTITFSIGSWDPNSSRDLYGIYSTGSLEIKDDSVSDGVGQLNVHAKGAASNNSHSYGITIPWGDLIINGGIVNAIAYDSRYYSYGVFVETGGIIVKGGSLTAVGAECSEEGRSCGIKVNSGKLDITEEAQEVSAIGNTEAIYGQVTNSMPGKGWTNVGGTEGEETIDISTAARALSNESGDKYKKVQFKDETDEAEKYDLWVGGTQVTSENCNDIPAAEGCTKYSGKASYDDSTKTLTLHDYNYEGPGGGYNQATGYSVYSDYDDTLVIVLEGTNNLKTTGVDYNGSSFGVSAGNGELRIMGSGTLNVSAGKAGDTPSACNSVGINAAYSIVIESGTVNATGETGRSSNGITSQLGGIAINGGRVTAKASAANEESYGLYGYYRTVTIGENALSVEASGETGAINTKYWDIALDNKISGTGWTDVEGTTGEKVFPAGTYTKGQLAGYKKMVFPEIKPAPKPAPTPAKTSGTPLTTLKAGKTSMTIAWQKVTGAEGYDIFFSRCDGKGKTTAKKAQTINGNSTFAWTRSGLTAGVSYKAYVKAYVMKNGSKQYVAASPLMHAYTKGYTKRYTNAKSVKVKKTKVSIKKGKTFKIKAKVKKLKKGKKLMPTKHELKIRYLTTDASIATVSKKGKIKGVKAGTCYVYAYAHNGVFKKIKVTVK